ncbi:DUF4942 domain-containing protein [Pseudomonas aeruginosa]|uniref:DUF4942 domain-containing protein n=1 Tax=Pseudomonas aeruginosa TaxID=287 RepID=UPI0025C910DD|nr:DUF4942 domain-containing protein [Pseudomonas aeruginosa]
MTIQQDIFTSTNAVRAELPEVAAAAGELVDDVCEGFFAPVAFDAVDQLLARYNAEAASIQAVGEFILTPAYRSALSHFMAGNAENFSPVLRSGVAGLYSVDGAIGHLNSCYWNELLKLTDVLEFMPYKRREEWSEQVKSFTTPPFEENVVRSTLQSMLASRSTYFAERVDGIFQALSKTHVTNNPAGFTSRFIIDYAESKAGYISDLRNVIARFMGHPEQTARNGHKLLRLLSHRTGEWHSVDGGALRMKMFKVGTVHCDVHPELAVRMNSLLAHLYPLAIPSRFRTKPKRPPKDFPVLSKSLPQEVISLLMDPKTPGEIRYRRVTDNPYAVRFDTHPRMEEAYQVLEALGGVRHNINLFVWYEFDYDPQPAIAQVAISGLLPDDKSHQYYPTRERLADFAEELADIREGHKCLEPSAGNGALAAKMPAETTTCIEISAMRCKVLASKGYKAIEADFLIWAPTCTERFDRIVLNPPFANNRATLHLQAAAGLLKNDGRLVAILPASLKGKDLLPGWDLEWHGPFSNEFDGTGVTVAILLATPRG